VDRTDWRTFRVDRIGSRPSTGARFAPRKPPHEDLAAYVSRAVSSAPYRYQARLTMHAPAEVVAERIPPTVGMLEPVDDHTCVLHTGADSVAGLAMGIAAIGIDFDVHEPPELVDHIRTLAARLGRATGRQAQA
jgi:predicted DNA-binding transcriptional regulator YafY